MTHDKTPSTNDLADDPASDPGPLPEGVYSDGALLWRAKPGATTTFEDLLEARELFQDLHNDRDWNPWRFEAAAEALERAKDTVEQRKRAEPGFRQWTASEVEEWMAQRDADFEGEQAERERQRERNLATYNAEREAARLDLLEQRHILARRRLELSQMRSGESFPQIDPERRAAQVSKLEKSVAQLEAEIERLAPVVGDPEDVVDEYGNLPRERRETTLYYYRSRRITRVRDLETKTAELRGRHDASSDNAERAQLRSQLGIDQQELDRLLAIPRLSAADMCADCVSPRHGHPAVKPPDNSPCVAWPGQKAIRAKIMKLLALAPEPSRPEPEPATPKPLAIVPSGLPIAEIMAQLQDLQRKHPDAVVRRGRANRWELWPPSD